jgi:hypothetical protein
VLEQITGEVVTTSQMPKKGRTASMQDKAKPKEKTAKSKLKTPAMSKNKPNTKQLTDGSYAMDGWSY